MRWCVRNERSCVTHSEIWEFVGPSRPPSTPGFTCSLHISSLLSLGIAFAHPHDNDRNAHDAAVLRLQPAAAAAAPLPASGRRLAGRDGVPLPGLHRGAPGAVPAARRDVRGDGARAGLRVLPGVRPAGGRDVRRVHPEVLHRSAVLPDPRLGAAPGAAGAGPGPVSAQSGARDGHFQPGAAGAKQRSVGSLETRFSSINF